MNAIDTQSELSPIVALALTLDHTIQTLDSRTSENRDSLNHLASICRESTDNLANGLDHVGIRYRNIAQTLAVDVDRLEDTIQTLEDTIQTLEDRVAELEDRMDVESTITHIGRSVDAIQEDVEYLRKLKADWTELGGKCSECKEVDVTWDDAEDQMGQCYGCYNLGSERQWSLDDMGR